jgi:hypothetical protein
MRARVIAGVVERVARSSERASFVLRGGVLTRAWVAPVPRAARDVDYVGVFDYDVADATARLARALATPVADDVALDLTALRGVPIWAGSPFPGVRATLPAGLDEPAFELSIDVGFRDPLVPPPVDLELAGTTGPVAVRAVRPETQLAWKLHGLAEMRADWRPKDLHDAQLVVAHCALDDDALARAIAAAFSSRGYPRAAATSLLADPRWATKTARTRWDREPPLADAIAALRARLDPVLATLPDWELPR